MRSAHQLHWTDLCRPFPAALEITLHIPILASLTPKVRSFPLLLLLAWGRILSTRNILSACSVVSRIYSPAAPKVRIPIAHGALLLDHVPGYQPRETHMYRGRRRRARYVHRCGGLYFWRRPGRSGQCQEGTLSTKPALRRTSQATSKILREKILSDEISHNRLALLPGHPFEHQQRVSTLC